MQDGDTVRNLDRIDADLDGRDVDFVKGPIIYDVRTCFGREYTPHMFGERIH